METTTTPPKIQTVVQGEASESDEDEENVQNSSVNRVPPFPVRVLQSKLSFPARRTRQLGGTQAVVVAGEASESDEEEVDTSTSETGSPELPPLKVEPMRRQENDSSADLSDVPTLISMRAAESRFNRPKYDTLLHRKLRESNWHLHEHMEEVTGQAYLAAARSLAGTTAQLVKSYSTVQDISHSLRLLTNDLFHLDDHIDIIQSCKLLPDIKLPVPVSTAEAVISQPPSEQ